MTVTFLEMWNAVPRQGDPDSSVDAYFQEFKGPAGCEVPGAAESGDVGAETMSDVGSADPSGAGTPVPSDAGTPVPSDARAADPSGVGTPVPSDDGTSVPSEEDAFVQPYADSPMDEERVGENVYITMIGRAVRTCWFMSPYLIITDEMIHAMGLAAKRGVDVRVITPGIPDKKMVYSVTRSFYNSLVRCGVRIYEWTPGFNHAKMCLVDGKMATCGTINLDYRSMYHHFENGCFFCGCEAVKDMERDFEETFAQCRDVTEQYRTGRSASLRLWQLFLRLFAQLM